MKTCSKCKIEKPSSEFHKASNAKDGLYYCCKFCSKSPSAKRQLLVKDGFKLCTKCDEEKPLSDFHNHDEGKLGLRSNCKECEAKWAKRYYKKHQKKIRKLAKTYTKTHKKERKDYREKNKKKNKDRELQLKYKITLKEYQLLSKNQKNRCSICGNKETAIEPRTNKIRGLAVDHNHETGKVRGLLCGKCNRGIGFFQENINFLQKTIDYLKNDR